MYRLRITTDHIEMTIDSPDPSDCAMALRAFGPAELPLTSFAFSGAGTTLHLPAGTALAEARAQLERAVANEQTMDTFERTVRMTWSQERQARG